MAYLLDFNGLDGTIGDLLALPGSHKRVLRGPLDMFNQNGAADLPGLACFGERRPLPPGSVIIVHSALLHARRAKPGFTRPRYFVDVSYCQPGRHRWPAYENFGVGGHRRIAETALELGHDRGGKYAGLFDTSMFCEFFARDNYYPSPLFALQAQLRWPSSSSATCIGGS